MFPKKNSSFVWKYFSKNSSTHDLENCNICKVSYKRGHSTSNLIEHLKRKHSTILERYRIQEQQPISEESYSETETDAAGNLLI